MKPKSYGIAPYKIIKGEVFLLLNKTHSKSEFNFFKGKQENDETVDECAVREFKEEAGIRINPEHLEEFFTQNSKRKNVGVFLVNWNKYKHLRLYYSRREIWSAEWVRLLDVDTIMSKNQQKIHNELIEHFKEDV